MKFDRILLLIAGIVGITAFFLPFIQLVKIAFLDVNISGLTLVQAILDGLDVGEFKRGEKIFTFVQDWWISNQGVLDWASFAGFLFVLLGPFFFLFFSLSYLIKGIRGKGSYRRGLVFLLAYSLIAFVGIYFGGQEYKINLNFFNRAGLGFWLSAGAIGLAWISRFLKPKSVETV